MIEKSTMLTPALSKTITRARYRRLPAVAGTNLPPRPFSGEILRLIYDLAETATGGLLVFRGGMYSFPIHVPSIRP